MQNKANLRNDKMNINTTVTMNYVILSHLEGRKNKPNSKPIKPITNPIKAKTKPIKAKCNRLRSLEFLGKTEYDDNDTIK
jgi:hypothetical protein